MTSLCERRKPAREWCLGYRVPAMVILKDGSVWNDFGDNFQVTVSALNPRYKKGRNYQPRGLFLDGPRVDDPRIDKVLAIRRCGKCGEMTERVDVTRFVKMGFGPTL